MLKCGITVKELLERLDIGVFSFRTDLQKEQFVDISELSLCLQMLFKALLVLIDRNFQKLKQSQN